MLAKLGIDIPKAAVGIYHSETLQKYKDTVFESLTSDAYTIKLVVETSSLGCGVNMKGVKFIVLFGSAFHTIDYCQQIGRDSDEIRHNVLYSFPTGNTSISKSMKSYITRSIEICLRQMIFTPLNENKRPQA